MFRNHALDPAFVREQTEALGVPKLRSYRFRSGALPKMKARGLTFESDQKRRYGASSRKVSVTFGAKSDASHSRRNL